MLQIKTELLFNFFTRSEVFFSSKVQNRTKTFGMYFLLIDQILTHGAEGLTVLMSADRCGYVHWFGSVWIFGTGDDGRIIRPSRVFDGLTRLQRDCGNGQLSSSGAGWWPATVRAMLFHVVHAFLKFELNCRCYLEKTNTTLVAIIVPRYITVLWKFSRTSKVLLKDSFCFGF